MYELNISPHLLSDAVEPSEQLRALRTASRLVREEHQERPPVLLAGEEVCLHVAEVVARC